MSMEKCRFKRGDTVYLAAWPNFRFDVESVFFDPSEGPSVLGSDGCHYLFNEIALVKTVAGRPAAAPAEPSPSDGVLRPAHYARFKIEPIYFIMENGLSFEQGNVVKYVCRWDGKDGIKDLKKARRYLDMMIKKAEGDANFAE